LDLKQFRIASPPRRLKTQLNQTYFASDKAFAFANRYAPIHLAFTFIPLPEEAKKFIAQIIAL
jgi:hypothetical protein